MACFNGVIQFLFYFFKVHNTQTKHICVPEFNIPQLINYEFVVLKF